MTKTTQIVAIGDQVDLADLLALAEAGTTTLLTRGGVPVVAVGPASGEAFIAREGATAYAVDTIPDVPQPATALMRLIGGAAARSVLRIFLNDPDHPVHQREVARRAGLGLRSAQLALQRLESLGVILSRRDGNRRNYQANRTPQFEELRGLMGRELGVPASVLKALRGQADRIDWAFIFGSFAAGTDSLGSDIDLLVVGNVKQDELVGPLAAVQRELGREIDVAVYRSEDFAKKRASGNHFVSELLAAPRIDLIGGPDDA